MILAPVIHIIRFDVLLLITPELGFYNTAQEGCVYSVTTACCVVSIYGPRRTHPFQSSFSLLWQKIIWLNFDTWLQQFFCHLLEEKFSKTSRNESSCLRYLLLFWPVRQSRAAVEHNLNLSQNTLLCVISLWFNLLACQMAKAFR